MSPSAEQIASSSRAQRSVAAFSAGPNRGDNPSLPGTGTNVLVIEDDALIRDGLAELLRDDGYEVRTANNGADALNSLRSSPLPDVILLDLMMPVMDGWQFRVEQKKDAQLARIPVIAMSASRSSQAEAIDAAAFVSKPLRLPELHAAIADVVSRAQAARLEHAERLAALGTLTAGVAHEIGNPLTYVIANLEQTAKDLPSALAEPRSTIPELVAEALHGARRIGEIVRDIQTLAHVTQDATTSLVDLRGCVERTVRMLDHEMRHRAAVLLKLEPTPPVRANAGRLEQVVMNLLMNALHALSETPSTNHLLTISTRSVPGGGCRFEVADTGPGVPTRMVDRVFEPFFTTRAAGSGTGLGLSICRSIIRDAGGEIGVRPAPGGGALFWFELPPPRTNDVTPAPHWAPEPANRGRLTVLAIDDDPHILAVLRRLLSADYEVITSSEPGELSALADQHRPDVVLMDMMMPGVSVAKLLDELRVQNPELAERVVLVTAGPFTPAEQGLVESGVHPVLSKPFTKQQLLDAVSLAAPPHDRN
jgi:signal transduction histidine kinase